MATVSFRLSLNVPFLVVPARIPGLTFTGLAWAPADPSPRACGCGDGILNPSATRKSEACLRSWNRRHVASERGRTGFPREHPPLPGPREPSGRGGESPGWGALACGSRRPFAGALRAAAGTPGTALLSRGFAYVLVALAESVEYLERP